MAKWTRNQKLIVWGIIVSSVFAVGNLYIQMINLEKKIQPVVEMKPQIINVIQNITKVEKEIANLSEMISQQDNLRESESFRINDLGGGKVKKINKPENSSETTADFLVIELMKVPLKNSIIVSNESKTFAPSVVIAFHNIIRIPTLGGLDGYLSKNTSFINVSYLPDPMNQQDFFTINEMTYEYREQDIQFHFNQRQ